jgi:hypothetical protein
MKFWKSIFSSFLQSISTHSAMFSIHHSLAVSFVSFITLIYYLFLRQGYICYTPSEIIVDDVTHAVQVPSKLCIVYNTAVSSLFVYMCYMNVSLSFENLYFLFAILSKTWCSQNLFRKIVAMELLFFTLGDTKKCS